MTMTATVDFAKHRGRPWGEYLNWMVDHEGGFHTKRHLAVAELTRRGSESRVEVGEAAGGLIELRDGHGTRLLMSRAEAARVADRLNEKASPR
jgi:hypothetical protein